MPSLYPEFKFCPVCSAALEYKLIEDKKRQSCPACDYINWGEYSLGVGGVLLQDDKVLLIQRAHNPGKGRWTIPGGYVEQNEKIAQAVVREVREETGILSKPVSILAVRDYPEDVPNMKHNIYIVFFLHGLGGQLKHDPVEVIQAGFYSLEDCRNLPIAPMSLEVITKAIEHTGKENPSPGLIHNEGVPMFGALSELFTLI
jgi:ADP-ribose pyrophosphatase YjhB (NUDIX family)